MGNLRFLVSISFMFFMISQTGLGVETEYTDAPGAVHGNVIKTMGKLDKKLDLLLSQKEDIQTELVSLKVQIETVADEKVKLKEIDTFIISEDEKIKKQKLDIEQNMLNVLGMKKEYVNTRNNICLNFRRLMAQETSINKNSDRLNKEILSIVDKKIKVNKRETKYLNKEEKKTEKNIKFLKNDDQSPKIKKKHKKKKNKK